MNPPVNTQAASMGKSPGLTTFALWRRRLAKSLLVMGVLICLSIAVVVALASQNFGAAPEGPRLQRMEKSPLFKDGTFENRRVLWNDVWGSVTELFNSSPVSSPSAAIDVVDTQKLLMNEASSLRVTWLGHSTVLIEIEGLTILTDPIMGERSAPVNFAGPKRWYAPPLDLNQILKIDVVLISHDHYDHLDAPTMRRLSKREGITYLAPLGVGAHLEDWGIAPEAIHEHAWGEKQTVGPVTFVAAEARHASGRQVFDQNRTFWASWVLLGKSHRVFFSGDTGFFPEFKDIGDAFGPFDLVMMESGAYNKAWPDWHIGPEQAVEAHRLLRGKALLPIHWGLFDLASHGWTEPVERVLVEAAQTDEIVLTPRPGEPIDMTVPFESKRWWPSVPWQTAEEAPIQSRGLEGKLPNLYEQVAASVPNESFAGIGAKDPAAVAK